VASIGLSMGALTQNLYTMIVTMAMLTTMAMPPMLRAALTGLPLTREEETRIQREAIDQRGFLPGLERLLLAVDDSPVGRMAARLAGLIAGVQGMPVTILKLEDEPADESRSVDQGNATAEQKKQKDKPGALGHSEQTEAKDETRKDISGAQSRIESAGELKADPVAREVKAGAKKSADKVIADQAEPDPEKVHLTARVPVDPAAQVVRDEARKGYDLMFIGLADIVEKDGTLAHRLSQLAAGFEGPLMLFVDTSGEGTQLNARSRLLVPVNGAPQSRRAAETAFAIARGTGARVHVLFVSQTDGRSRTRLREERVLKDMVELGERYNVPVTTRISARAAASGPILKEAKRNTAMIVMGVSARAGEGLFFGNTATAVLKDGECPALMVVS
jgi:nucleotide-binding universal stress UspA family protein